VDRRRVGLVTAGLHEGAAVMEVLADLRGRVAQLELPGAERDPEVDADCRTTGGDEAEDQELPAAPVGGVR
jgi:hypothetical protein